jgi:hypothetical protein
MSQDE